MLGSAFMGQFLALSPKEKKERLLKVLSSLEKAMLHGQIVNDENGEETDRITVCHSTMNYGLEELRMLINLAMLPTNEAEKMIDDAQADEDRDEERLDFYRNIGL